MWAGSPPRAGIAQRAVRRANSRATPWWIVGHTYGAIAMSAVGLGSEWRLRCLWCVACVEHLPDRQGPRRKRKRFRESQRRRYPARRATTRATGGVAAPVGQQGWTPGYYDSASVCGHDRGPRRSRHSWLLSLPSGPVCLVCLPSSGAQLKDPNPSSCGNQRTARNGRDQQRDSLADFSLEAQELNGSRPLIL